MLAPSTGFGLASVAPWQPGENRSAPTVEPVEPAGVALPRGADRPLWTRCLHQVTVARSAGPESGPSLCAEAFSLGQSCARRGVGLAHLLRAYWTAAEAVGPASGPSSSSPSSSGPVPMLCEAASRGFEAAMVEDAEVRLQEYREAVARALHDVIGGDVALTMRLLELHRAHPEGDRVSVAISTLGGVLSDIRGLITDVRVRPRRASIGEGLRAVVATAPGGVSLDVQVTGDESAVPAHLHQEVFLVLREGLRNAFRHAGASVVRVRMRVQPTVVLATLEDDGRGLRGADADTDGYGIVSMRQRVRALGGRLLISDGESGGTTLQIEVPLPKASEPAAARPGGAA